MSETCTTYGIGPDKYADELQTLRDERDRLREALEFYADPGTYHACIFIFDPPTGGFDEDFDEGHDGYDRPMPGKTARAALTPAKGVQQHPAFDEYGEHRQPTGLGDL